MPIGGTSLEAEMAMRYSVAAILAGASVAWTGATSAGPLPEGGVTVAEVAGVMRGLQLQVDQRTDKQGNPLINSTVSGLRFGVYFYQCKAQRCGSIQFSAAFEGASHVKVARVMEWNRTKRYARAFLDSGTLFVEMDMDVKRGATTEALANNLERWAAVVDQFPAFFE